MLNEYNFLPMKLDFIKSLLPFMAMVPLSIHAQHAIHSQSVSPLQKHAMTLNNKARGNGVAVERMPVSAITLANITENGKHATFQHRSMAKTIVQTPFLETFDSGLGDFSVIDANNDGKTWSFTDSESYAGNQGVAFYTYHRSNQANDWLVTPGIKMTKGVEYEVSFETWCASTSDKERLEVRYGNDATVSALTEVLVDGFDVAKKYADRMVVTKKFTPAATGNYYFGFHAMSDPWKFYLFIDNVSVKAVTKASAPDAVTDISATPAENGGLQATLRFTAPAKDQNGNALNAIDSIRVTRKGITVALVKSPVPGSVLTVIDNNTEQGNNKYTVVAFADGSEGKAATVNVYTGQDVADAVDINSSYLHDDLPSLTASWAPVSAKGVNGGYVDPSQVKYVIAQLIQSYNGPVALPIDTTDVAVTSYDFNKNPDEGEQAIANYLIAPLNIAGIGTFNYIDANTKLIGKPYQLPFEETVNNGELNGTLWWYSRSSANAALPVISEQSITPVPGSGSIGWKSDGKETMSFNTGKISLADAVNPVLRFSGKGAHGMISAIAQKQNGEKIVLGKIDLNDSWQTTELPLSDVKDSRYVVLRFQFSDAVAGDSLFLDDIHVLDALDNDLQVIAKCNDRVRAGEELRIGFFVYNSGQKKVSDYKVVAKWNDEKIYEGERGTIIPGDAKAFSLGVIPSVFSEQQGKVSVCVEFAGDEKPDNNKWEKSVSVDLPKSSPVENLSGSSDGSDVTLTWKAPANPSEEITEDFESYEPWTADNFSSWICYSNDETLQGGLFSDVKLPHEGESCAFILTNFDDTYDAGDTYPGHSGYQYLSTFYGVDENGDISGSDKWLISPLLSGKAQTVSFYAKSEAANGVSYPENLIMSYSTDTTNPADFQKAGEAKVETEGEWKNYTFSIPDGALYFAIERFDPNGSSLWLGLDDISYSIASGNPLSYNVYKNRLLYKNVSTTSCSVPADSGNHEYSVTAVYASGESIPVSINVATTGIHALDASAATDEPTYWTIDGRRLSKPLHRGITIIRNGKSVGKYY